MATIWEVVSSLRMAQNRSNGKRQVKHVRSNRYQSKQILGRYVKELLWLYLLLLLKISAREVSDEFLLR